MVVDPETSSVFLLYIRLIKPIEVLFVDALFGREAGLTQAECLFVENGKKYDAVRIRCTVEEQLSRGDIGLNFSGYRQYQCWMSRGFIPMWAKN